MGCVLLLLAILLDSSCATILLCDIGVQALCDVCLTIFKVPMVCSCACGPE